MERVLDNRLIQRIGATVGVVGSVALGVLYLVSAGLVVPKPALYVFWGAWAALVVISLAWWRRHPWRTLAIPIAGFMAASLVLWLGGRLLGWTG